MEKQLLTLEKLQNRILSLEEERLALSNALDIALKINDIQPDAAAETTVESILSVCYERTGRLIGLKEGGFYLFREEDAVFYQAFARSPAAKERIEH